MRPIAQTLNVFGIGGIAKTLSEFEEFFLLSLLSFDAVFDQLNDRPIRAQTSGFRHGTNFLDHRGQGDLRFAEQI